MDSEVIPEIILGIDTSSPIASVALKAADKEVVVEAQSENSHSEELLGLVEEATSTAGVDKKDITTIVIGAGPGSFTGLRIGFSFVQGLALSVEAKVVPYSTLRAGIESYKGEASLLAIVSDARRGEYFCSIGELQDRHTQLLIEDRILSGEEIVTQLKSLAKGRECCVIGDFSVEHPFLSLPYPCIAPALISLYLAPGDAPGYRDPGGEQPQSYSGNEVANLAPNYVRGVNAKTIEERTGQKNGSRGVD